MARIGLAQARPVELPANTVRFRLATATAALPAGRPRVLPVHRPREFNAAAFQRRIQGDGVGVQRPVDLGARVDVLWREIGESPDEGVANTGLGLLGDGGDSGQRGRDNAHQLGPGLGLIRRQRRVIGELLIERVGTSEASLSVQHNLGGRAVQIGDAGNPKSAPGPNTAALRSFCSSVSSSFSTSRPISSGLSNQPG